MQIKAFLGLNTVGNPLSLGLSWLSRANDINITAAGRIERRAGFSLTRQAVGITGAYATLDEQRAYYVDNGTLRTFEGAVVQEGLGTAPMSWTEVNGQVFFANGINSGIIGPDHSVLPWAWPVPEAPRLEAVSGQLHAGLYRVCCTFTLADGRETGPSEALWLDVAEGRGLQISDIQQLPGARTNVYIAPANSTVFQFANSPLGTAMTWNASPDALGMELLTEGMDPLPAGDLIAHWKGRIYVALFDPENDQTVVWFSQALGFHLFNLATDFVVVPGRVLMLAPHDDGLVVGTDRTISVYTGDAFVPVAPYGVVPGYQWDTDGKRILFWTQRGLCEALPFTNLTEGHLSVAPGLRAGGAVVSLGGQRRFVATLQPGGQAFNPYPSS